MDYTDARRLWQSRKLPCAFVDLDALDNNRKQVTRRSQGLPVRIASKSIRCRAMLNYLLAQPGLAGIMCFTAAEAVWLAKLGFDNLLVAYPSQDREAIAEVCTLVAQGKRIYLMLDNSEQARLLEPLARQAGAVLPICLDLDMSSDFPGLHFGVWRSPLRDLKSFKQLYRHLQVFKHLRIAALMGYEAQIAGVGDQMPGQSIKNRLIQTLKRHSAPAVFERRQEVVDFIEAQGLTLDFVNGGGSGSLEWTAQDPSVTELTAGSAFFAPTLFDTYQHFQLEPAAGFALPIVRQPAPDKYTCLGGGYIASGSVGLEKQPQVWLPTGARLTSQEGAGEVQTPVHYSGPEHLSLGDPILFRHAKAGELCERFNTLLLLRQSQPYQVVPTYRGEGQCFL